jgi:DNA-binding CsgD family transcriptional regulator/PAS domain-containing protein
MEPSASFSQVISSLYDCAIVPDLWPRVLPMLANYMKSRTAAVSLRSRVADKPHFFVEFGIDEAVHELYVSKYRAINPRVNAVALFGVDEPVRTEDILDVEEFQNSPYYKEFDLPYGIGDVLGSKVIEDGQRTVSVNVSRAEAYNLDDVERLRSLCPHIRRVMTIADLLERKTVERDLLAEVLDRLSIAVILVDPKQRIMHANAAAEEFLATGETLSAVHGVLTASGSRNNASLRQITRASDLDAKQLPLETADGRVMVATVLPLVSGLREAYGRPLSASAAVFVHNQPSFDEGLTTTLAAAFGLTGAEARILCALLEGLSLADVARRHQISLHTVRTHLQRLFVKTNTNRQADLIRLASNAIPPIRPQSILPSDSKRDGLH